MKEQEEEMTEFEMNLMISSTILNYKGEFITKDIFDIVKNKIKEIKDAVNALWNAIERKIKAMWEANILVFTGFSYYVNI